MSSLLAGLNPQQTEAVLATEGPVLVLAGAGSGKTRVIAHRVAYLVLDKGVPSERILAVTFTNKAAAEMKGRVEALLGGGPLRSRISTFHSFCVRILREDANGAGLTATFLIYDDEDQLAIVREALEALGLPERIYPPRRVLALISAAKNGAGTLGEDPSPAPLLRIAERYENALRSANALDFDDLLLKARDLLRDSAEVRSKYRRRFPYILVDEYQDTNRVQYELVRLLSGEGGNLTVVGDEDQSIYSWRGADIRNILSFEEDFPGARVLRLEANYRSSQAILDAALGLVSHNASRKGKELRAVREGGQPVTLLTAEDEFEEAALVVDRLAPLSGRSAILYRTNSQSRLFEEALARAGLSYVVVGGVGFYERKEVRDILAYLRFLASERDDLALRRVLNVPPRGIGKSTLEALEGIASNRGVSLWEALVACLDGALLPERALSALRGFRRLVERLREGGETGPKALIERVLAATGYQEALLSEGTRESQERSENLQELLRAAAEHEERGEGLPEFLDRVALISETDKAKGEALIFLMTLHAAKGLEFQAVFLVGMEEGVLPHSRSSSEAALEEERRLCYVGMTRAMERLHLCWAKSRALLGRRGLSAPSRFLREIGSLGTEAEAAPPPPLEGLEGELHPGRRVRHPFFGVGTVIDSDGSGEELKVTVSFSGIGRKRLVARYAGLRPA